MWEIERWAKVREHSNRLSNIILLPFGQRSPPLAELVSELYFPLPRFIMQLEEYAVKRIEDIAGFVRQTQNHRASVSSSKNLV